MLSSIFFFIILVLLADFLFFIVFFLFFIFLFLQLATYAKGLARRTSLTEGAARVVKSYKTKVVSLTSDRAGLLA